MKKKGAPIGNHNASGKHHPGTGRPFININSHRSIAKVLDNPNVGMDKSLRTKLATIGHFHEYESKNKNTSFLQATLHPIRTEKAYVKIDAAWAKRGSKLYSY